MRTGKPLAGQISITALKKLGPRVWVAGDQPPDPVQGALPSTSSIRGLTEMLLSDAQGLRRAGTLTVGGQRAYRLLTPAGAFLDVAVQAPTHNVVVLSGPVSLPPVPAPSGG